MVGIARALEPLEQAQAKGRQGTRTDRHLGKLPGSSTGDRRDKPAAVVGVSGRTLDKARAVVEAAGGDPKRYGTLVAEMDRTGNVSAAIAGLHRLQRRDGLHTTALPNGKFRVIYADPPYRYSNAGVVGSDSYGRAERHYATLSMDELCALPVKAHVANDAVLFLWVPAPLLMEARGVIEAWGFSYKTGMVWDKEAHNYGHYVSVRHEHLLICTRGKCTPDRPTPMPDSVVSIRRSARHSEKPEEFRHLIAQLYPFGRRLELFGRKHVDGWTVWGDQVGAPSEAGRPSRRVKAGVTVTTSGRLGPTATALTAHEPAEPA